MYAFDYTRPETLADAIEAMQGEEAQALSGGQTLIPTLKQRLAAPATLVDLTGIGEIKGICMKDGAVSIGAATCHAAVAASAEVRSNLPGLAHLAGHIGDPQVRNRGTLGGSLANNDPAACYPAGVLGLGATVHTSAGRAIAADDFFQGMFTTALEEGELITSVDFPVAEASAYAKFVQPASRFALTGVFVAKIGGGVRVAVTGASEGGVFRWGAAEDALSANFSASALDGVALSADGLIADLHGTPEYRANIARVMAKRAVASIA